MILPFVAGPFGVFLMRQYISALPDELIQAARIDGAGELRIFASVIMPLCGPALATLGILTFLGSWNNFLWPLVVAQTEDKYTLPVALALYAVGQNATQYGLLLAGSVVVVVPVLVIFLFLQRHIMQGIAMTGIKYARPHPRSISEGAPPHALAHSHRRDPLGVGPGPRPARGHRTRSRRHRRHRPGACSALPGPPGKVLDTYLRDTWKSFTAMVDPGTGLVSDNVGGTLAGDRARRTPRRPTSAPTCGPPPSPRTPA